MSNHYLIEYHNPPGSHTVVVWDGLAESPVKAMLQAYEQRPVEDGPQYVLNADSYAVLMRELSDTWIEVERWKKLPEEI